MSEEVNVVQETVEDLNEILRVRREKLSDLVEEGRNPFEIVKYDQTHHTKEILDNFDAMENQEVSLAGRMMSRRDMGKLSSAIFRTVTVKSSFTFVSTISVKRNSLALRSLISVISSALRVSFSAHAAVRFPSTAAR